MYLSRLTMADGAVASEAFWRAFGSEYALHQSVWRMFGDRPDRRRDFLYRLDSRQGKPLLWTLSQRRPQAPEGLWRSASRRLEPDLAPADRLDFALRVNPVVCRAGKRHDVVMDRKRRTGWSGSSAGGRQPQALVVQDALSDWLAARAGGLGVRLVRVLADGYRVWRFRKPSGRRVSLGVADLSGTLEIVDAERFLQAWKRGVGPAKGFGCGLMLIRRAAP